MRKSPVGSVAAMAVLVLMVPVTFALHLRLVRSAPTDRAIVTTSPTEIRLWFNQKPEVRLTSVRLLREDSTPVPLGKVVGTDDSVSVEASLETALLPGTYTVTWRSISRDGHTVRGRYYFNLVPGAPARKQTSGN